MNLVAGNDDLDTLLRGSVAGIAAAVRSRAVSVTEIVDKSLARITVIDDVVHAFTDVCADRARSRAADLDRELLDRGGDLAALPLLGVPFAVRNLFDVAGLATHAVAKVERGRPPARRDAPLVARLEEAGAVLVGALDTGEPACDGFTPKDGDGEPIRNPHDPARTAGGSAAAVAAGQVPLALGSDANGSIRIPASLCGVFGLKPTYGRLPRNGTRLLVASLDQPGAFARHAVDLAAAYDAMQGADARDPACTSRPVEPTLPTLAHRVDALRVGILGDWFHDMALPEARTAVAKVAEALDARETVTLPQAERARAAAFLITSAEGAALHLPDLRQRPQDFAPPWRERLFAGALLPAAWVQQAQRLRRWFALRAAELLGEFDILLAPSTPCVAPAVGAESIVLGGRRPAARPSLGLLTEPISFIGLPVVSVPVWGCHPRLPIGVQVIGAPWREDLVLRVAHHLQHAGIVRAPVVDPYPVAA